MALDQITNEELEEIAKKDDQTDKEVESEKEMTFLDHLEELRWHIIRSLIAVLIFTIGAFMMGKWFFHHVIFAPSRPDFWTYRQLCALGEVLNSPSLCIDSLNFVIQSRQLTGQFMMHITASMVMGVICAFPYIFWEIWRFVKPGLYKKERKAANGATFYVSILFILGVLFGYYVVSPLSINFLASYQIDESIKNEFDIISYVSTLTTLVLACAILFQLPVVVFFFAKVGILTPEFMRTYRRHSIIVILVLAGVITPPDLFSQVLISIPLFVLYEISIGIAKRVQKQEKKKQKEFGMSTVEE